MRVEQDHSGAERVIERLRHRVGQGGQFLRSD